MSIIIPAKGCCAKSTQALPHGRTALHILPTSWRDQTALDVSPAMFFHVQELNMDNLFFKEAGHGA